MPDSFSKTIPIWCAVWNVFRSVGKGEVDVPGNVVSVSEKSQMELLVPGFVRELESAGIDFKKTVGGLKGVLKPVWVTRDCNVEELGDLGTGGTIPVICVCASASVGSGRRVEASFGSDSYLYVQGAADDHELWAQGLTPRLFWKHQHKLLADIDSCEQLAGELVAKQSSDVEGSGYNFVGSTNIAVGGRTSGRPPECWQTFDAVINCGAPEYQDNRDEALKSKYLYLDIPEGKRGQVQLGKSIEGAIRFAKRFVENPGMRLLVHCSQGMDRSVGISLAILAKYFGDQGGYEEQASSEISKETIRTRLLWITTSRTKASPPLSQSSKNAAVFDRALGVIRGERRRFEQERAEWDVERIRLKSQITAHEKRIELLSTQYTTAQRQISLLESLLVGVKSGSDKPMDENGLEDTGGTVGGIVKETRQRRERSRALLQRCLEEIDVLLSSDMAESAGRRRSGAGINGVIESELDNNGSWRLASSVSAPIIGDPNEGRSRDGGRSSVGMTSVNKRDAAGGRKPRVPVFESQEFASLLSTESAALLENAEPEDARCELPAVDVFAAAHQNHHDGDDDDDDDGDDDDEDDGIGVVKATDANAILDTQEEMGGLDGLKVDEIDVPATARPLTQWQISKTFTGHLDTIRALSVRGAHSEDSAQVLSGSDDGLVILWDVERGSRRKSRRRATGDIAPQCIYRGHLASVTSVMWEEGHEFAYSGSLDSSINIWNLPSEDKDKDKEDGFAARQLMGHTDAVWDLSLCTSAGVLVSASADGSCRTWSIGRQHFDEPMRNVTSTGGVPASVQFVDTGGAQAAVGYVDGGVSVYDTEYGVPVLAMGDSMPRVTKVAWNMDHLLAVACIDGSARICDLRSGDTVITLNRQMANMVAGALLTSVDIVAGKPCAVAGASDGVVAWWDWRNPIQTSSSQVVRHRFKGDEGVCAVQAFSTASGGQLVASAGSDARIFFSKKKKS
ncbi:tRNA A64-2'-O-ribosylphosphate transferase [Coemansia sp. RSA 1722]|nr:tRNA A64-2'-O-ribosylphosphate transferase [Coemansia sp. RSA 1722]